MITTLPNELSFIASDNPAIPLPMMRKSVIKVFYCINNLLTIKNFSKLKNKNYTHSSNNTIAESYTMFFAKNLKN